MQTAHGTDRKWWWDMGKIFHAGPASAQNSQVKVEVEAAPHAAAQVPRPVSQIGVPQPPRAQSLNLNQYSHAVSPLPQQFPMSPSLPLAPPPPPPPPLPKTEIQNPFWTAHSSAPLQIQHPFPQASQRPLRNLQQLSQGGTPYIYPSSPLNKYHQYQKDNKEYVRHFNQNQYDHDKEYYKNKYEYFKKKLTAAGKYSRQLKAENKRLRSYIKMLEDIRDNSILLPFKR